MAFFNVFLEILSWLPAMYAFKFSSVCTSFHEFLSDNFFIEKQARNMMKIGDTHFFIQPHGSHQFHSPNRVEFNRLCSTGEGIGGNLPFPSMQLLSYLRIIASSNGLLVCRDTSQSECPVVLVNPTTMRLFSVVSPDPNPNPIPNLVHDLNIIFSCEKGDMFLMVILHPMEPFGEFSFKIYSPEHHVWNHVGYFNLGVKNIMFESCVFHAQVVYLISDPHRYFSENSMNWPYLMACDVAKSTSVSKVFPKNARKQMEEARFKIFKCENAFGFICLIRLLKKVFTVWILSSDLKKWQQTFKMRARVLVPELCEGVKITNFAIWNRTSLVFTTTQNKVYCYNLENGQRNASKLEEVCSHSCGDCLSFLPYQSTLRHCGPSATTYD